MQVELVVFDIAGTTVKDNGEIALAFQQAMKAFKYDVPVGKINPLMGYNKTEAIKLMLNEFETIAERITEVYINEIHNRFLAFMVEYYTTTNNLEPLPYAEEVFSALKERGVKIGLDTGFSNEITDVIIDRLGWIKDNKIDSVISSNQVKAGRPFSYMIEELMRMSNVQDVKKVIKIGDTEVDVNEGKNAGCLYSIAITTGAFTKEEFAPYNPSFIIEDLKELITIIDNV